MRIKVESGPPLGPLKAWFIVPAVPSVQDLKEALCADIAALHERGTSVDDFTLVLEGFELLDNSAIGVIRDGDLIR